jgi:hypothetical protein
MPQFTCLDKKDPRNKMKLLFWFIMVSVDDSIVHPLWNFSHWIAKDHDNTKEVWTDQYLYRFCQWSWANWYKAIEEYEKECKSK